MRIRTISYAAVEELREHIRQVLCAREDLQPGEYPFVRLPIRRGEQHCGELLIQHGPRLIRLLAVWDPQTGTVHYYDCNGERFRVDRVQQVARAA